MKRQLKALVSTVAPVAWSAARKAVQWRGVRRVTESAASALDALLAPSGGASDFYGRSYFERGAGGEDGKVSGYGGTYSRESSHADVLARLVMTHFNPRTSLEVGCARGYLVEALREQGVDASGCDYSVYAVNTAARGARGHVVTADLTRALPYGDRAFELVCAFETLEHLPPEAIPHAISELARVSSRHVVATIPSFGPRPPLPPGWFEAKVRPERLEHYRALGPAYDGPVPFDDLCRDANGEPLEGHLCIASFAWWRRQFEAAGLEHREGVARDVFRELEVQGLAPYLDFYVFSHPAAA